MRHTGAKGCQADGSMQKKTRSERDLEVTTPRGRDGAWGGREGKDLKTEKQS